MCLRSRSLHLPSIKNYRETKIWAIARQHNFPSPIPKFQIKCDCFQFLVAEYGILI